MFGIPTCKAFRITLTYPTPQYGIEEKISFLLTLNLKKVMETLSQ